MSAKVLIVLKVDHSYNSVCLVLFFPFFKTGYIFEDFEDGPIKRSKFDRLVTALKEIYDELPVSKEEKEEYELFISGHSLGGALCNLFAFGVAETQQGHSLFNRVTAVSFASPVVGTKGYNKAFQVSALFGSGGSNGTSL